MNYTLERTKKLANHSLKACPFCGEKKEVYLIEETFKTPVSYRKKIYYIQCYQCMSKGPRDAQAVMAVIAWNNRKRMGGDYKRIKELEESLRSVLGLFEIDKEVVFKETKKMNNKNTMKIRRANSILQELKRRRSRGKTEFPRKA